MKSFFDKCKPLFSFLVLLLWSSFIFLMSSIPGNGIQSNDLGVFVERKGAHIIEYAILVFLWMKFIDDLCGKKKYNPRNISILLSFFFASLDEMHQLFVFGRTGKITDLIIDLIGILIGVWIYDYFKKNGNKIFSIKNKKTSR